MARDFRWVRSPARQNAFRLRQWRALCLISITQAVSPRQPRVPGHEYLALLLPASRVPSDLISSVAAAQKSSYTNFSCCVNKILVLNEEPHLHGEQVTLNESADYTLVGV